MVPGRFSEKARYYRTTGDYGRADLQTLILVEIEIANKLKKTKNNNKQVGPHTVYNLVHQSEPHFRNIDDQTTAPKKAEFGESLRGAKLNIVLLRRS